jgi:hypothetical protein
LQPFLEAVFGDGSLQGLTWLPLGVALILNQWLQDPRGGWDVGLALALLAAGIAGTMIIGRWYRNHYGFQRPFPPPKKATLITIALLVLFYIINWLEAAKGLPVSSVGLAAAAIFGWAYRSSRRLRWYYGVAALLLLITAIFPAFGISSTTELWGQRSRIGMPLFVAFLIVCGALDHRLLRRLFPIPREDASLEHTA